MLALNNLYYILICHRVSFALPLVLPPSISFPNLVSILLLPLMVFYMLALLFRIPSPIISDLPTLRLLHCLQIQSKTHLFSGASISGPWKFLSTHFWFDIIMLIFVSWIYVMLWYPATCFCSSMDLAICNPVLFLDLSWNVHDVDDLCGSNHLPVILSTFRSAPLGSTQQWNLWKADWDSYKRLCEDWFDSF